jgi:hypothetical protein
VIRNCFMPAFQQVCLSSPIRLIKTIQFVAVEPFLYVLESNLLHGNSSAQKATLTFTTNLFGSCASYKDESSVELTTVCNIKLIAEVIIIWCRTSPF